jgi:hypothetical protein
MAIIVKFDVKGADSSTYDEVLRRITEMYQGSPDGRMYHVSYGDRQDLQVIEVYESQAHFDAFGKRLMPLLQELGIEAKPTIEEVYKIVEA